MSEKRQGQPPAAVRCEHCGEVVPTGRARRVWAPGGWQIRCYRCLTR